MPTAQQIDMVKHNANRLSRSIVDDLFSDGESVINLAARAKLTDYISDLIIERNEMTNLLNDIQKSNCRTSEFNEQITMVLGEIYNK